MKRCLSVLLLLVLLMGVVVMPASAASNATRVDSYVNVDSEGNCQVSLTVTLHLESADSNLTFPLPVNASNITMNGSSARTSKTANAIEVDITRATGGLVGDFTIRFDYNIPKVVGVTKDVKGNDILQLVLPLVSGFSYPIKELSFIINLPGDIVYQPDFHSVFRQSSIESDLDIDIDKRMISGRSVAEIHDSDSMTMFMVVPQEMFPSVSMHVREGNPEVVPMLICAGLALVYWLLFLRTWPLIRTRSVTPPEGVTAGEMGCHLTLHGGDLTMMVWNWAQMGYILIQLEGRRVMLYKRMDMGNERSQFEIKIFHMLFGSRRMVDATSPQYARLSRKVFAMIPGERNLLKSNSGNMKLFRALCCGSQVFCGICVAMNMTSNSILQVMLSLIFGIFGAISAWQIHEIAYRTHLRGKTRVYIGLVCILVWVVLGILCGEWIIPTCTALGQWAMGYFAAYGGRRSDVGRHDAGRILGLRSYLKKIPKEDLTRLQKTDPDYFFNMAPFALSLGVILPFARQFGARKLPQCPYLVTRVHGKRTAEEWAYLFADAADAMDARYRRMEMEKWLDIRNYKIRK